MLTWVISLLPPDLFERQRSTVVHIDILPALQDEDSPKGSLRFRVSSGVKDAFA